jgi:TrmH family RNA methyltransferase
VKFVHSRGNPLFKSLLKLKDSPRERLREGSALLDGPHLVAAYIERIGEPQAIAVSENATETPEIKRLLEMTPSPEPIVLSEALFRELSPVTTPSGILAVVAIPPRRPVPADVECCLLVEDVQDPGNLGSILRSAAGAGVRHILLSRGCADAWSPRVLRGAMGAHYLLAIEDRANLVAFARDYRGQVVAGAADAATSIFDIDLKQPTAFAIGNEGSGLSPELAAQADVLATVPMAGGLESINVGAAAAVCLFERVRQLRTIQNAG